MPGLDGTGPDGMGQMTGGGFGVCVDPTQGAFARGFGRGRGRGRGLRQRFAWDYYPSTNTEQLQPDNEMLQKEVDFLKSRLSDIEKSLSSSSSKQNVNDQSSD
jgi:hypothetical protein